MKIKDLTLYNFGKYGQVSVSFDEKVTYLVGPNGIGKTTLGGTGVQFMFEGIAEKAAKGKAPLIAERFRFIGPNAKSSKGEMTLFDEKNGVEVKVFRTMTKDANTVRFEGPAGMKLDQEWLTALFNEFMISPKKFTQLSAMDQARALGIDTTTFDSNIKALKEEYTGINRDLKQMGSVVPAEHCQPVDLTDLKAQKEAERTRLNELYTANKKTNVDLKAAYDAAVTEWNNKLAAHNKSIEDGNSKVAEAFAALANYATALNMDPNDRPEGSLLAHMWAAVEVFKATIKKPLTEAQIEKFQPKVPEYVQEMPPSTELDAIDEKIMNASETNVKATAYTNYLEKQKQYDKLTADLEENKNKQQTEVDNRLAYIKSLPFPFEDLNLDEEGGLMFQNKLIKEPYFSTGELIKLIPILLSSLGNQLKYVFIQDFNLLDAQKQQDVEKYLTDEGYQLVIEYVGSEELTDKNCILLTDRAAEQN